MYTNKNFMIFSTSETGSIDFNEVLETSAETLRLSVDGSKTFVKWDEEKNKCYAGFTVSGDNVGVNESITVSGEALSFLSTGIDTRVYFIKNF